MKQGDIYVPSSASLPFGFYYGVPVQAFYLAFIRGLDSNLRVVDVGCGQGFLAQCFHDNGHRVLGIDGSEPLLDTYHPSYELEYLEIGENAKELPMQVDLITCMDVLEHVEKRKEVFAWLANEVSRGANLLISLPSSSFHGRQPRIIESDLKPHFHEMKLEFYLIEYPIWYQFYQRIKGLMKIILGRASNDDSVHLFHQSDTFQARSSKGAPPRHYWLVGAAARLFKRFPMSLNPRKDMQQEGTYLILVSKEP